MLKSSWMALWQLSAVHDVVMDMVLPFSSQGLKPMDSNGLADPYVKLHLLPGASKVKDAPFLH